MGEALGIDESQPYVAGVAVGDDIVVAFADDPSDPEAALFTRPL